MQDNKEFWDKQAKMYKTNLNAVNFDENAEELELENIKKLLGNNQTICDLGCGNGKTIFNMIESGIKSNFYGIDFTKGMIDSALEYKRNKGYKNCNFYNLSASSPEILTLFDFKFDTIISKRLLINLKGNNKYKAIDNIYNMLKDNGQYILVENFIKPLENINKIRTNINLDNITVHQFNEYLDENFFENIKDKFIIEKKIDFMSLYYFISRIFNTAEKTPDYKSKINLLALEITKLGIHPISDYSPQILYVLKKV